MAKHLETDEGIRGEHKANIFYDINTTPPWHLCIAIGLQHLLVFMSGAVGLTFALAPMVCIRVGPETNDVAKSEILGTLVFTCGIATLLQTIFGSRLPIIQGASASFLPPAFAILSNFGDCPTLLPAGTNLTDYLLHNQNTTETIIVNGSEEHDLVWKTRIRALQGGIMVASLVEIFLGFSGLLGYLLRFIGPMVIAVTITLIGLPLFPLANSYAASQWGISMLCVALMLIFTQYLGNVKVTRCRRGRGEHKASGGYPIFKLLAVMLTIVVAYIICIILTYTNVFPDDKQHPFYRARTDFRLSVLSNAKWFRVPYPGEFGMPTVTIGACFGMFAGVLASMVESVGDYYAAARISGAPVPTAAALNRGIGIEGFGSLLSGVIGSGCGLTSYSMNIGAMNTIQVGSRRVIEVAALSMIVLSVLGKFCALFVTIPDPILGGIYIVLFGMLVSIGMSNLQHVDLNSPRNHFIIGTSMMLGLTVPAWVKANTDQIQTGCREVDEVLVVLLSTNMFVGGVAAFFMDNTISGTLEERGMLVWAKRNERPPAHVHDTNKTYDMPFGMSCIYRTRWTSYVPFCPNFGRHDSHIVASQRELGEKDSEIGVETELI
ncbi:solute carrier family 23 member 2-like [Watersipora subatra]|uniref:solute carrier family 23 member 2-like n=1 Tax=Watersipora subatra TaxID=2589382 RepID=UPI00355C216D